MAIARKGCRVAKNEVDTNEHYLQGLVGLSKSHGFYFKFNGKP